MFGYTQAKEKSTSCQNLKYYLNLGNTMDKLFLNLCVDTWVFVMSSRVSDLKEVCASHNVYIKQKQNVKGHPDTCSEWLPMTIYIKKAETFFAS